MTETQRVPVSDRLGSGLPLVAVLMTVFNRRETTLRALDALYSQKGLGGKFDVTVHMVDDRSYDGTVDSVRERFPYVKIIVGSGELFWSGGMALAERCGLEANPDFILWLNDDVVLDEEALDRLLSAFSKVVTGGQSGIIVGSTKWFASEAYSYGGARLRNRHRPTSLAEVKPNPIRPRAVDAFNGNVVLMDATTSRRLGGIDAGLGHAYGDIDYGLRARKLGIQAYLVSSVGRCDCNDLQDTWQDTSLNRRQRLALLFSRKGVPIDAHWRFVRRHGSWMAPAYFIATYAKCLSQVVLGK